MPKKILIINIFGIGDVLFTTPMIRSIKNADRDAEIGYVCNQRAYPVLKNNPAIKKFHIYEKDEFRRIFKESVTDGVAAAWRFVRDIKEQDYDVVFDISLNRYMDAATALAGIPQRIGYNFRKRSPFLNEAVDLVGYEQRHVVEYYLALLKWAGIPVTARNLEVHVPEGDQKWARQVMEKKHIGLKDLVVGLIPGGGASWGKDSRFKRWEPESYATIADKMIEQFSARVILMGNQPERLTSQRLLAAMQHHLLDMTGQTTLEQYLALLQCCHLVVTNDGGPLHMAVAAGARTVSIFGPVNENVYGPYPPDGHRVVKRDLACRPCYHQFRRARCETLQCLKDLTVEQVFEQVNRQLTDIQKQEGFSDERAVR